MPSIESLNESYKDAPFEILTIDVQESKETVREFMDENGYSFTVLLDSTGDISADYAVRSHPMKFLIDSSGKIVASALGYRRWDSEPMKALVNKLIAAPEEGFDKSES